MPSTQDLTPARSRPASRGSTPSGAEPPPQQHPSTPHLDPRVQEVPPGTVDLPLDGGVHVVWPYTTAAFPPREQDPINVIFAGCADPREVRAALLSLEPDRAALAAPFPAGHPLLASRWRDSIGGVQAAYSAAEGWTGSAVQLECGEYGSFRAHLRLFAAGRVTLANAHVDMLIPGTAEHEVISWELARRLVVHDLVRSGLLDPGAPPVETPPLFPDTFRRVDPAILAAMGPLRDALVGDGSLTADGALRTSGRASVLTLAGAPPPPRVTEQEVVLRLDQRVPKPFCNRGDEHVRVQGTAALRQRVAIADDGSLTTVTRASGELWVTPVDPVSGEAIGRASPASASDSFGGYVADDGSRAWMTQMRELVLPAGEEAERLEMEIGPGGRVRFLREETPAQG